MQLWQLGVASVRELYLPLEIFDDLKGFMNKSEVQRTEAKDLKGDLELLGYDVLRLGGVGLQHAVDTMFFCGIRD